MRSTHPLFFQLSCIFLLLNPLHVSSSTRHTATTKSRVAGSWSCGNTTLPHPPFLHSTTSSALPSPTLAHSLLCKSQILYLRTSLGLFPISSINVVTAKTLTLSSPRCPSPSSHYVSPVLLSSAFSGPRPPHNSLLLLLLLLNCTSPKRPASSSLYNCTTLFSDFCASQSPADPGRRAPCWLLHDLNELEVDFHPSYLGCSHYSAVFIDSSSSNAGKLRFGMPVHLPSICEECSKPDGNCGVGLRCLCHPKQCEDSIFSSGATSCRPLVRIYVASSIVCYVLGLMAIPRWNLSLKGGF